MTVSGVCFLTCCGISSAAPQNTATPKPPTHNYDELKNVFLKPADKHYTRRLMRTHILFRPLTIMQKRCFSL